MSVNIIQKPFLINKIVEELSNRKSKIGAIVSFTGYVRDFSNNEKLNYMFLEHYPGMTEKSLKKIESLAKDKWDLYDTNITHRVGKLFPGDGIVAVVVSSKHRSNAFRACEFIIDYLKTDAPFWKKEVTNNNETWVAERKEDHKKKEKWKLNNL
jgi:molybdopterin synthase catalytic subunit